MDIAKSDNNLESNRIGRVVNYMGTSWIIRRSKSHNGMLYYFNTMTNEAVWNLNDAEIEKAKKLTKSLENQMVHIECPEPKDPPMSHESYKDNDQSMSKVYNKQIINNQMQPLAYFPSGCTQVLPYGSVPMGLNVPGSALNPNIWSVPPVFLAPVSSVIKQAYTPVANNEQDYKIPVQNTSIPLSSRFPSRCETRSPLKGNNFQIYKQNFGSRKYKQKLNNNDLRNVLSARKGQNNVKNSNRDNEESKQDVTETVYEDNFSFEEQNNISVRNKSTFEEKFQVSRQSDVDIDFEDETNVATELNVAKLKQLAGPNANSENWYIATDTTILLNHLNFLSTLMNADKQCKLMVPREVLEELRVKARDSCGMPRSTNRARRAVLFVKELLKTGCCILGDSSHDGIVSNCYILKCCSNLIQQNYHVVLLTNDKELLEIKGLLNIPIFAIKEVKEFLTVITTNSENYTQSSVGSAEKIVKITVINDLVNLSVQDASEMTNLQIPGEDVCNDQHTEVSLNNERSPNVFGKKEIQSHTVSTKKTIDAGVQTKIPPEKTSVQIDLPTTTTLTPPPNVQKSIGTSVLSSDAQNSTIMSLCEGTSKKERRLIRSVSRQTTISNSSGASNSNAVKKQFKWRKRRHISKTHENNPHTFDNSLLIDANSDQSSERNHSNPVPESNNQFTNTSSIDIVEDSETGSSIVHRNINEKVIIEETSTSGVISNTSYAESECESVKQHEVDFNEENMRKNIMFEVKDRRMEQSLRMRCDEWVSRFVQIMEEALTQLLQRNQKILQNVMPPPWTLYEAIQCVKVMFRDNHDVSNASNRLMNVLDTVSNGGRIKLDLTPSDYMEMYSYGVYLIDILQSTSQKCEDLLTAANSLSNLLSDVNNPNLDVPNDTYCDNTRLESHAEPPSVELQNAELQTTTEQINSGLEPHSGSPPKNPVNEGTIYNLRSKNKNGAQDNKQQSPIKSDKVSFIRNIDIKSSFFANLNLQHNKSKFSVSNNLDNGLSTCDVQTNDFNTSHRVNELNKNAEPKIFRNFNKCSEFEVKLRNKSRNFLDMDQLDYSEDAEENYDYMDDNYYSQEECYNGEVVYDETVSGKTDITDLPITKPSDNIDKKLDINANNNFASISSPLFLEIKEAFSEVQSFCKETVKGLAAAQYTSDKKNVILENTEKAYSYIDHLCKTLDSIRYRETCSNTNIQSILKQVGLDEVNDTVLGEYRLKISKCMDQAKLLLDTLNLIKSAVKA